MCGVGWNISGEGDTSVRAGQHRREGPPGQGATSTSGTALISVYSQVPYRYPTHGQRRFRITFMWTRTRPLN